MESNTLLILSLLFFSAAALLVGSVLLRRAWDMMRTERMLNHRIDRQENSDPEPQQETDNVPEAAHWLDRIVMHAAHWVDTPIGRQLVAEEDRRLLDQCGVNDNRGKTLFFLTRTALGIFLPIFAWTFIADGTTSSFLICSFFGFGLGYMGPKWAMQWKARDRRRRAAEDLPLLIDLLRLLQGVGLSIDQSLHVIETEFAKTLPVLSRELQIAARQYLNGRSREQSLRRFSTVFNNDDINAIARLIVQVDHYGGAVQQPLQQFSDRVREQRKLDMKEKVGKLTVKMTGVMVLTLLPALLIITGGSGFLAIIRTLSRIGH